MPKGAPRGLFVAFATSPDEVAIDGEGSNSPYTEALVRHIPTAGLPFEEIFQESRRRCREFDRRRTTTLVQQQVLRKFFFCPQGNRNWSHAPIGKQPFASAILYQFSGHGAAPRSRQSHSSHGKNRDPGPRFSGLCQRDRLPPSRRSLAFPDQTKTGDRYETDWVHSPVGSWEKPGFPVQTEDHPVACINWHDANAFCRWLSSKEGKTYRLPTDKEWSAAAGSTMYPWGDSFPPPQKVGNYWDLSAIRNLPGQWEKSVFDGYPYQDGGERTAKVGSYPANKHGFHDLGGNLWNGVRMNIGLR